MLAFAWLVPLGATKNVIRSKQYPSRSFPRADIEPRLNSCAIDRFMQALEEEEEVVPKNKVADVLRNPTTPGHFEASIRLQSPRMHCDELQMQGEPMFVPIARSKRLSLVQGLDITSNIFDRGMRRVPLW